MRGVRQACTRVARAGYDVEVRRAATSRAEELDRADRAAADAWRGDAVERGFSMALSRLGDPADGELRGGHGRPGRRAARPAALRAVGPGRAVAGPDAPRPHAPTTA